MAREHGRRSDGRRSKAAWAVTATEPECRRSPMMGDHDGATAAEPRFTHLMGKCKGDLDERNKGEARGVRVLKLT